MQILLCCPAKLFSDYVKFQSTMENICTYSCLSYKSPTCHFQLLKCMTIKILAFIKAKCLSLSTVTESKSVLDCTGNSIFLCKIQCSHHLQYPQAVLKKLVDQLIDWVLDVECLPINQQSCVCQMVFLHAPNPNHLVSSSYISLFCHNIFYDVQTPFDYSLELFDKHISTLLVISWHSSDKTHFLVLLWSPPFLYPGLS